MRAVHAILLLYNIIMDTAAVYDDDNIYAYTHIIYRVRVVLSYIHTHHTHTHTHGLHVYMLHYIYLYEYIGKCVYVRCDWPAIFHRRRLVNNAALQRMNDDDDLSLSLIRSVRRVIIHIIIILLYTNNIYVHIHERVCAHVCVCVHVLCAR